MSSETSPSASSEESFELVENLPPENLIRATFRALESDDGVRAKDYLIELRKLLLTIEGLNLLVGCELRDLLQLCFSCNQASVSCTALTVLTYSLQALSSTFTRNPRSARVLLQLIKLDVVLEATSSELLVPAFEMLAWWCSQGSAHRRMFLEVYPIEFLDEIYTRDTPMEIFSAYMSLVASIVRYGSEIKPVLPTALKIFARSIRDHGVGKTCEIADLVCQAMTNALDDCQDGNVVEEVLDSRLVAALVRHVTAYPSYVSGGCVRHCLMPMIRSFVNSMASCEAHCQRFVDQGILQVIEVGLNVQNLELNRYACMALTNAFAYSPFSIEYALHSTIAERLFRLRDNPDEQLRKEALRAASNLFSKASSAHMFSMVKLGYVPDIVKLLRSPFPEVVTNALQSLFAVIAATNYTDPLKLPALYDLLSNHDLEELTAPLQYHKIKEIRLAALAVHRFMAKYPDEEELERGAIPKWIPEQTPSDIQSVMSLPR